MQISNNIVVGGIDGIYGTSSAVLINNCVCGFGGVSYHTTDINVSPQFAADGCHLLSTSPCKDAGDNNEISNSVIPDYAKSTDMDAKTRILYTTVDMGAYEYFQPSIWYVSLESDPPRQVHDGTSWATAFTTITDALNDAQGGDEIWVAEGSYSESSGLYLGAGVGLYGGFAGNETTRNARNWVTHPTAIYLDNSSIYGPVDSITFFTGLDGFIIEGGACGLEISVNMSPMIVAHNIFWGNDYGIACSCSISSVRIVDNWITGSQYCGVTTAGSDNVVIANNTITSNLALGMQIQSGSPSIVNNIIAFNNYGFSCLSGEPTFVRNCVYGNTTSDYDSYTPSAGDGNISSDPLLIGVHIHPNSPCRDASANYSVGNSYVAVGDKDIDVQARNSDGIVDIGADESDGSIWGKLTITASDHLVPIGTNVTITATYTDALDQGISGALISFSTTGGCGVSLSSSTATTDANGVAQVTLYGSTCIAVVTIDGSTSQSSGWTATDSDQVTFYDPEDTRVRDIVFVIDRSGSMDGHEASYPYVDSPLEEASIQKFVHDMSQLVQCTFGYAAYNTSSTTRSISLYNGANKVQDFCNSVR